MSTNYGNHSQDQSFTNFDMTSYQGSPMATAPPLEPSYGVHSDQTLQFGTTMSFVPEPTQNNTEFQSDFAQNPPGNSSGYSEDGSANGQFQCKVCNKTFPAQYKLTLVSLSISYRNGLDLPDLGSMSIHTQSHFSVISAPVLLK
jgi:hypothetical protein